MTTHEPTRVTDSRDEPDVAVPEEPRIDEQGAELVPERAPTSDVSAPNGETADPATAEAGHQSSAYDLLFSDHDLADLRARWAGVQAAFVDDPRDCVQKADALVSDLVEQLTTEFAQARSRLEDQWSRGEQASTEDLRVALMHYREFFERLLVV
jgi:hypothetical protein